MGLFWDYFKNQLRWPLIWQPGPLGQVAEGGAGTLDKGRDDCLWFLEQFVPEKCDDGYLDAFAGSRGVRRWPSETDAFWRARVMAAFKFFKEGGRLSGLHEYLALAGLEVEIVEAGESRAFWSDSGGLTLDGSWLLDGGLSLVDFFSVTRLPFLDWAEFAVVVNLASTFDPGWSELLRYVLAEVKPARSVAVMLYRLSLLVDVGGKIAADYGLYFNKLVDVVYPRCTPRLDGSWELGDDGGIYGLSGDFALDGSWFLGGGWPDVSGVRLLPCDVLGGLTAVKEVETGRRVLVGLGESLARLNGGWQLGRNDIFAMSCLRGRKDFEVGPVGSVGGGERFSYEVGYPAEPVELAKNCTLSSWRRLDGSWGLGCAVARVLDGGWQLVALGVKAFLSRGYVKEFSVGRYWDLGYDRKVDGLWSLGAGPVAEAALSITITK